MDFKIRVGILFLLTHTAFAQIEINFQIVNANQTLDNSVMNQQLEQQNLTTGEVVSSGMSEEVIIQQCGKGTYSDGGDSQCYSCPAGTASPHMGASSATTCQTCFAGSFAPTKSSACTDCAVNTFSTTAGAADASFCTSCPSNSVANAGSDHILDCSCTDRFFSPHNVLTVLDPPAPVQVTSWQAFSAGTILLDIPHLKC